MKILKILIISIIFILLTKSMVWAQNDLTFSISPKISLNTVPQKQKPPATKARNSQNNAAHPTVSASNKLLKIDVSTAAQKIILKFIQLPTYNKFYLKNPTRLVIDIDNCILPQIKKTVKSNFFQEIRAAQYRKNITRIVLQDVNAGKFTFSVKGNNIELTLPRKKRSFSTKKTVKKKKRIEHKNKVAVLSSVRRLIIIPLKNRVTIKLVSDTKVDYRFGTFGYMDRFIMELYDSKNSLPNEYIINEPPITDIKVTQPLRDKVRITFFVSGIVKYAVDSLGDTIYITFNRPSPEVTTVSPAMKKQINVSVLTNKLQLLIDEKENKLEVKSTVLDENKKLYADLVAQEKKFEKDARAAYDAGEYDTANLYATKTIKLQLEITGTEKRYKTSLEDFDNTRKYYENLITAVLEDLKRVKIETGVVSPKFDEELRVKRVVNTQTKQTPPNKKELSIEAYRKAVNFINKGKFYKALSLLNKSLKYDPTNKRVLEIRDRLKEQLEF